MTNTAQISTAQKNVTTSGTPVQLEALIIPDGAALILKPKSANTGTITVGSSSANALNTGTAHFKLEEPMTFQVQNANAVWIDATVSGEGIELAVEF